MDISFVVNGRPNRATPAKTNATSLIQLFAVSVVTGVPFFYKAGKRPKKGRFRPDFDSRGHISPPINNELHFFEGTE